MGKNPIMFYLKICGKQILESSTTVIMIDKTELWHTANVKFLGVIFNENLLWSRHIEQLAIGMLPTRCRKLLV